MADEPLPSALPPPARVGRLTARERQVLALRAEGRPVAEVAAALRVAPRTVRFHLEQVYAKLGLAAALPGRPPGGPGLPGAPAELPAAGWGGG